MVYPKHIPEIVKPLAKDLSFSIPNDQNRIYITFDDGPHPEITPWVLDQLKSFHAKATFFLVGANAEKHPEVVDQIRAGGHSIGLHGYSHMSGWKTKDQTYFTDIALGSQGLETKLFRPPYGQITQSQAKHLKEIYRIIMWTDLSADFDARYTGEQCAQFATRKVKAGSIIVFHDSEKAWERLEVALPKALEFYAEKGFEMCALEQP